MRELNMYKEIRYTSLPFIIILFITLMFGRGSSLVANMDPRFNPVGVIMYICCVIYLLHSSANKAYAIHKSKFGVTFFVLVVVWTLLHMFVLDNGFPVVHYSLFGMHFFVGILLLRKYGKSLIVYYEKSMVFLSIVSLICWLIQVVGGTGLLLSSPILLENVAGNSDFSLILYTIANPPVSAEFSTGIFRNSGCAWEPGLFSVMLNFAIIFNIIRNKTIQLNRQFIILLITLLSTFSTTGYVTFIVTILGYYLLVSKISPIRRIFILLALSIATFYIFSLPFMREKIVNKAEKENFSINNTHNLEWSERNEVTFTADRFEGILLDLYNIFDCPIVGYGLKRECSFVYKNLSPAIITTNNLTKPLAQLGVPLGLMLLFLTFHSMRRLSMEFGMREFHYLLFSVFVIGGVSYLYDSTPFMRAIEIYVLYKNKY